MRFTRRNLRSSLGTSRSNGLSTVRLLANDQIVYLLFSCFIFDGYTVANYIIIYW